MKLEVGQLIYGIKIMNYDSPSVYRVVEVYPEPIRYTYRIRTMFEPFCTYTDSDYQTFTDMSYGQMKNVKTGDVVKISEESFNWKMISLVPLYDLRETIEAMMEYE